MTASEKSDMFADVHDLFIQTSNKATAGARRLNKSMPKTKRRMTQTQIVKKVAMTAQPRGNSIHRGDLMLNNPRPQRYAESAMAFAAKDESMETEKDVERSCESLLQAQYGHRAQARSGRSKYRSQYDTIRLSTSISGK